MSLQQFIEEPFESCRTILSLGMPGSGKTFCMLKCLKEFWIPAGLFDELHLVLPTFAYEQNDSYAWLQDERIIGKQKVFIYNFYNPQIGRMLLEKQKKFYNNKKKGVNKEPKIFFAIDDTTHQRSQIFKDSSMIELATTSRHIRIHTWIIMHYTKNIIPKTVRMNASFVFALILPGTALQDIYEDYISCIARKELPNQKEFINLVDDIKSEHPCVLIDMVHRRLSTNVCNWFT